MTRGDFLSSLKLSTRSEKVLRSAHLTKKRDLARQTAHDLVKNKGLGRKSLVEIVEVLAEHGVTIRDAHVYLAHVAPPTRRRSISPDMVGRTFGRLLVVRRLKDGEVRYGRMWLCRCSCGTDRHVATSSLVNGSTRSCGCLSKDSLAYRGRVATALSTLLRINPEVAEQAIRRLEDEARNLESRSTRNN